MQIANKFSTFSLFLMVLTHIETLRQDGPGMPQYDTAFDINMPMMPMTTQKHIFHYVMYVLVQH